MVEERGWVVEVLSLVFGQRSVREKEWLETVKTFGISVEDGKRIIYRLGSLLLLEHEKLFASYWREVFGPPSSFMYLLGKDLSVRSTKQCLSLIFRPNLTWYGLQRYSKGVRDEKRCLKCGVLFFHLLVHDDTHARAVPTP